jgi:hypothetical protein
MAKTIPLPNRGGSNKNTKKVAAETSKSKGPANKPKDPNAQARADARAAEKRAVARANADKKKAGKRFLEGATNLEAQAKAIRQALDIDFASARDNNLADIDRVLSSQLGMLTSQHRRRADEFLKTASDNEIAAGSTTERSFTNLVRERQDALTGILEQGAGETDTMRAMLLTARNWHANASESNRAYFDTQRSINAGINDLNIGTQTELANAATTAEADRERMWQKYYDNRVEAFTQLGNIKGQQADLYAQAKEMGVKPKKGAEKAAEDAMNKAFKDSAVETGKSYTQQGLPTWISDYQGQEQVKSYQSNSELAGALTMDKAAKAEGATLRKWAS